MSDTLNSNTNPNLNFESIDYTGVNSASSYALPITPLHFIPEIGSSANTHMVWDFGDGTFAKSFSASHYYKFPGVYTVHLVQYDCDTNDALISTFSKEITIHDYFPLTFNITAFDAPSGSEITDLVYQIGQIEGPLVAYYSFPWYQPALDIFYDIYNTNSLNWWDINHNKFAHLETFNVIYEKIYNYTLSSFQFAEIPKISPVTKPIFVKVLNGVIVTCLSSDFGSVLGGLSATKEFFIKDDAITPNLLVDLRYDKVKYKNPYIENFNYLNNLGITLSAVVGDNTPTHLSITSNGLDGEGYPIPSFRINPIKFYDTKIPFVVKIKDAFNFSIKNFGPIPLSALTITVTNIADELLATETGDLLLDEFANEILAEGVDVALALSAYSISSLNYTLSAQTHNGSFRGYIIFPGQEEPLFNVKITVSATLSSSTSIEYTLEGSSNYFNVYPVDWWDLYKKNEDFNAREQIKDLRFQEILIDKHIFFDDFVGGVLGGVEHEDIGTATFEGAANFVANTQDIDVCVIDALNSMGEFMGYNDVYEERYLYPPSIKHWVDVLSIDKVKLVGYENKFVENFDIKGRSGKTEFGTNIGNQIDTTTYVVSADVPIVALEKFSNNYTLLNTYQPVSAAGSFIYPLAAYSDTWGWPLVLPTPFNFVDIEKYYLFFEFVDTFDGTLLDGVIDFNNPQTTIPESVTTMELNDFNGIKEHMFLNTLYKRLSIIEGQ